MSHGEGGEARLAQSDGGPAAIGGAASGRLPLALVAAVSVAVLGVVITDAAPWLRGPAPYPPEWQWGLRTEPGRPLLLAAAVASVLVALVATAGGRWWRGRPRAGAAALLAAATLGGLTFAVALLDRGPDGALRTMMARAQSPSVTSYHAVAVSEDARDALAFLRSHASLLPALLPTAKHAATHPPGPVLWYRAAVSLCESSPALTGALLAAAEAAGPPTQTPQRRAARAGALLGSLGFALLAVLTVWPLARLAESLGLERLDAARVASVFVLLPGPALFAGTLDAALALPVAAAAALVVAAARTAAPARAWLLGAAAGACAAVAVFGSYGALAFLALAGLVSAAATVRDLSSLARFARAAGAAALAFLALAVAAPSLLGHEPVRSLTTALAIHRTEFTAPRSYALWLLFDPLDFALFAGLPFALLAAARAVAASRVPFPATSLDRFRAALLAGIAALVLSGLTRGEVGRLWIPLVPLVLVAAAPRDDEPAPAVQLLVPAALAAAFTLAIASRWSY